MTIDLARRGFFRIGKGEKRLDKSAFKLPWLKSVDHFLNKCTQCGACAEHCPEQIITKGSGGYPTVDFSLGECTFCQQCTQHCPEQLFDTEQAQPWQLIPVLQDNCFAQQNIMCQSCADVCDSQAIHFQYLDSSIPKPVLDSDACTGCGACVSSCPAKAIDVQVAKTGLTQAENQTKRDANQLGAANV